MYDKFGDIRIVSCSGHNFTLDANM